MQETITVDTSRKALVKRVALGALFYGLLRFKGLITMPIVTRYLDPAAYGMSSLVSTIISMVWPVLALNLHTGTSTYLVHYRERSKISRAYYSAFNVVMALTAIGAVLMYVSAGWTGLRAAVGPLLPLTCVYLVAAASREFATLPLQVFQNTTVLVGFNASLEIVSAVVAITALVLGYGVQGFLWATILTILVWSAFMQLRHVRQFRYSWGWDSGEVAKFLKVAGPLMPISFSQWALQSIDAYFILHFLGETGVGVNSVAYSLAAIVMGYLVVLNYVYFPTLVALWEQAKERFTRAVSESLRYSVVVLGAVVLGFVSFAPWAVSVLAGPKFAQAALIAPLIACSYSCDALTQMYRAAYLTVNKNTIPLAFCHISAMILNVWLNFVTIPRWGLIGAGVNTLLAYGLALALVALVTARASGRLVPLSPLLRIVFPLSVSWAIDALIPRSGFVMATLSYGISLVVYSAGLAISGLLTFADVSALRQVIKGDLHG